MVVGLAVRHEYYGVKDEEGRLLLYVKSYIPSLMHMLPLKPHSVCNSTFMYDNIFPFLFCCCIYLAAGFQQKRV